MNKWIKFIDSCVGNVARKIQDEFDESKHPRDKGGKFTSKGGESRGGKEEKLVHTHKAGDITPERADALNEAAVALEEAGVPKQKILKMSNEGDLEGMQKLLESKGSSERRSKSVKASKALKDTMDDDLRQISEEADSREEFLENAKSYLEDYLLDDLADGDYAEENFEMSSDDVEAYVNDYIESGKLEKVADRYYGKGEYSKSAEEVDEDEGYMGMSKKELQEEAAEEDEWENRKDKMRRGSRNRRTYEEDDDDDAGDPVAKMRKHLDNDLFELATRSESEEEFISKAERRIKQDLWAAKSAPEELPVKGQKAEYALKKILSEIKSGTSEYW